MTGTPSGAQRLTARVWWLAAAVLVLHVATSGRYGYFGDELYFLACTRRLAWSYVDLGPASIALLRAWTAVAGTSLAAIRIVPALTAAATVIVTALLARRLGGGAAAQATAALAVAIAPGFLIVDHYYSMNAFDPAIWAIAALVLLHALDDERLGWWIALGIVLGVGLLNKLSVAWLGAGLAVGLALTRPRVLAGAGPWIAAAIAALAAAPIVAWQAMHGWPTAEFIHNVLAYKLAPVSPGEFVRNQAMLVHPLVLPIAMVGLVRLLAGPAAPLGVVYLSSAALLFGVGASKAYYLLGAYPPLVAAGGVAIEAAAHRWRPLPGVVAIALGLGGIASLPLAVPVLPVDGLLAYERALGFRAPTEDRRVSGELPGHFANMHGWPEVVGHVAVASARAAHGDAVVLADDYMEAAAIEELGRSVHVPPVVGTHDSWAMWPAPNDAPARVILVGTIVERASAWFDDVRIVDRIACTHCLPWRVDRPIAIASGLRVPLATVLAEARHFD